MDKETLQYKLDDIYARKDELKKYKETFKENIENYFLILKKIRSLLSMNN
jgi:hypothetical protein